MNNKTSNITQQISNISRQMNKRLRIISPGAGGGRAGGSVSRDGGRDGHRRPAPAFQWSRDRCYRSWGYMWDAFSIVYLVICLLTWLYVCLFIMSARKLIWTFRKIFITPRAYFTLIYSIPFAHSPFSHLWPPPSLSLIPPLLPPSADGTPLPGLNLVVTDKDVGENARFTLALEDIFGSRGVFSIFPESAVGRTPVIIKVADSSRLDFENSDASQFLFKGRGAGFCVYLFIRLWVCVFMCIYVCLYVYASMFIYVCLCVYTNTFFCLYLQVCINVDTFAFICFRIWIP